MRNASKQFSRLSRTLARTRLASAARRAAPLVEPVERRVLMSAAPGSLDPSFGTGGELSTSNGPVPAYATAVATQPDGDVIVARGGNGETSTITRLTPTGAVDATFGTNGAVTVGFVPSKVFVLSNGNVLLTGGALEELTPTGAVDTAYGTNGIVNLSGTAPGDAAVGRDGSAYVVENGDFVAKYTPTGSVDTTYGTFGYPGQAELQFGPHTETSTVVLAVDANNVVSAGVGTDVPVGGNSYGYGIIRLSSNGSTSQANTLPGFTSTATPITTTAIVLGPDGTAYVGAYQGATDVVGVMSPALAPEGSDSLVGAPAGLAVQADGKAIAVGSYLVNGKPDQFAERLNAGAGGVDATFGNAGVVDVDLGSTFDAASSVAVNADGDVVVAGGTTNGPVNYYTLAALVGGPGAVAGVLSNGTLTVTGTAGADTITFQETQALQYTVSVNGASQVFAGPIAHVVINAGDGNDTVGVSTFIQSGEPDVSVSGGAGDDYLSAYGNSNVTLDGGDGNDTLAGSSTDELPVTMLGGAGNDTFEIQDDVQPVISGGDGNDIVIIGGLGATDPVSFAGGAGNDTLEVDAISYNGGATSFNLDGAADSTIGFGGPSTLGADIENVVIGNANSTNYGPVSVTGDALDNSITVYAGIYGATVHGGDGNDTLSVVGGEADAIYGDAGNDTLVGGTGANGISTLSGGAGTDVVDYSADTSGVSVYLDGSKLSGNSGQTGQGDGDQFDGTTEIVYGGSGADLLVAAPGGGDALYGNGGNDTLTAQGGADALFGGPGNDTFNARDGGATYIDGGDDTDTAYVDASGDTTVRVENVITPPPTGAAVLANGVLTVTGTANADTISVQQQDPTDYTVTVNGVAQAFAVTATTPINSIVVNAGDGNDTVSVVEVFLDTGPTVSISGGAGDDSISYHSEGPSATLDGGDGNDHITASSLNGVFVTMLGDAGNDSFEYQDEVDASVNGGDGNDTLTIDGAGASMPVSFVGGAGTDTLDLATPNGANTINLDGLADSTITGAGFSTFGADIENVTVGGPNGSSSDEGPVAVNGDALDNVITVYANIGGATVHGGDGNDTLSVIGGQNNAIYGDAGNDTLTATGTAESLYGGAGNDTFFAKDGAATYIDGGDGTDTATTDATGDTTVNVETVNGVSTTPTPTPTGTQLTGTTYGTAGAGANTVAKATDGNLGTFYDSPTGSGGYVAIDLGSAKSVATIKFASRAGWASRMVGGQFQASNTADFSSGTVTVYTVASTPGNNVLTAVSTNTTTAYRYWRYIGAQYTYSDIAEFQLFGGTTTPTPTPTSTQLTGTTYGTAGAGTNTVDKATDGSLATFYDSPTGSGGYVAIDLKTAQAVAQIKFAPRSGWTNRMVGGRFQASNTADFSSGVVTVYTVTAAPTQGVLTAVPTNTTTAYRYWRYIGANYTYTDIAEFQLFGGTTTTPTPTPTGTKVTGKVYTTAGRYPTTNGVNNAVDGSLSTYFESTLSTGGDLAIDLGAAKAISQIGFAPRAGYASRMVGGYFQASNTANFSSGAVTIYTIAAAPTDGSLSTVSTGTSTAYRYWRYVGPAGSSSDIAEFQLFA